MILAIDPGLNNFGIVVLDYDGNIEYMNVVQSKKTKDKKMRISDDYTARIRAILDELYKVNQRYEPDKIVAEMPSFGAQASAAAISLSVGATIIISASVLLGIPVEYRSPVEVKKSFVGHPAASKKEMMDRACMIYAWPITYRTVNVKNKPPRHDPIYHVSGRTLSAGYFEHIADAIAVAHTIQQS